MTGSNRGLVLQPRDRRLLEELAVMRVVDREQARIAAGFGSITRVNARLHEKRGAPASLQRLGCEEAIARRDHHPDVAPLRGTAEGDHAQLGRREDELSQIGDRLLIVWRRAEAGVLGDSDPLVVRFCDQLATFSAPWNCRRQSSLRKQLPGKVYL